MFFIVGFYYPLFYLQLYTIKLGLSKNFAFYVVLILSLTLEREIIVCLSLLL